MTTDYYDLNKFLDRQGDSEFVHFVLPGVVVSGKHMKKTSETITLRGVTVYTGSSQIEIELIDLPIERILAWGEGEIRDITAQSKAVA